MIHSDFSVKGVSLTLTSHAPVFLLALHLYLILNTAVIPNVLFSETPSSLVTLYTTNLMSTYIHAQTCTTHNNPATLINSHLSSVLNQRLPFLESLLQFPQIPF